MSGERWTTSRSERPGHRSGEGRRRSPAPGRRRDAALAAFSLIEILIAVLILALGLLGLGAVFPVIVREQKLGNDIIVGTIAANSARTMLKALDMDALSGTPDFWRLVRDDLPIADYEFGQWAPSHIEPADLSTGTIWFGGVGSPDGVEIPVASRLYPVDSPASQPQFVWDAAVQRVVDGDGLPGNDDLRVAIFVRRIDPRIRVPGQVPLFMALANRSSIPAAAERVPVAEDAAGLPTLDGLGGASPNYAQIRTAEVQFDYNAAGTADQRRRDRLYARSGSVENTVEWRLARQPNQKLIDNLGNVYTVLEAGELNGREFVRVSPEVPAYITTADEIVQVAFTPQVAAAIVTWRVTP